MARVQARISVSSSYTEPRQPRWPGCRSDAITGHTSGYLAAREPLHATPTTDNSLPGDSVSACAMHEQQNEPRSGRPEQTRHRAGRQHCGLGEVEPRVGQRPAQPPRALPNSSADSTARNPRTAAATSSSPVPPECRPTGQRGPAASSAAPRPTRRRRVPRPRCRYLPVMSVTWVSRSPRPVLYRPWMTRVQSVV